MNNKLKTSFIMAGLLSTLSGVSFAQQPSAPTITAPEKITQGNSFEREVTPLLREISRKKAQLELRKLDRDLERIDEESLKAQMSMEGTLSGNAPASGVYNPFAPPQGALPVPKAMPATPVPSGTAEEPLEATTDIKVLMIYGFDDVLHAKVSSGNQGGYVVKKGDILPNGQVVHKVTGNFIEVVRGTTGKGKKAKPIIQRIFLSAGVPPTIDNNTSPNRGGSASSVRPSANDIAAASLLAPVASPGARK